MAASGPVAYCLIRPEPHYRVESFVAGLRACGFTVVNGRPRAAVRPDDALIIWNRYGQNDQLARLFETQGATVICAENGLLGRDWKGEHWYSLTLTNPVACGRWTSGGPERWDTLGVTFCEWRKPGHEVIILAQRGIGPEGVRQPDGWHQLAAEKLTKAGHKVRIREHPGERPGVKPVEDDILNARCVVTWASAAAFKSLLMGVPVLYGCPTWIGRDAALPLIVSPTLEVRRPDRLPTFRRLAWAIWRTQEIATGAPFRHLMSGFSGSASTRARKTSRAPGAPA